MVRWGQGLADLSFDQAEHQQGQADHGDQGGDAPVAAQEHRRDGEWSFELAVAAFDYGLALVVQQDLGRVGLVGGQVGQQRVPAVDCRLGVDDVLVERPVQGRFPVRSCAAVGAQVGADAAGASDRGQAGVDLGLVGVVVAAQATLEAFEVLAGFGPRP
ncbi:hypothetical protein [Streptomyces sp. PA03-2a]|uniref:hypothetical protein n=1 Tax=Streptomyces sp. PA03-2a TaxID=3028701 RepID=UPI0029B264F6|nr:hypothetical protein [Streptomyces sp. PA03-2a]MDX2733625.1 hypothetical protein [Streptomyces sp. PA03-2a]